MYSLIKKYPNEIIDNLRYEKKLLYFIDILGFRELVKRSSAGDVFRIIRAFMSETINFMKIPYESFKKHDIPTFYFSDHVITVVDYDINNKLDLYAAVYAVMYRLSRIQLYLLSLYGILIRGSVVYGDIFYDIQNNIIYGPALVEAYEFESKSVLYPRIGISNNIIHELGGDHFFSNSLPNPYDPNKLGIFNDDEVSDERAILTVIPVHALMRKDKDGIYFVDYLKIAFHLEEQEDYLNLMRLHMSQCYKHLFNKFNTYKNSGPESVLKKILWVIGYHNQKLDELCSQSPSEELEKYFRNLYIYIES